MKESRIKYNKSYYILYIIGVYIFLHNPHLPFGVGMIKLLYIPLLILLLSGFSNFHVLWTFFNRERKAYLSIFVFVLFATIMGADISMVSIHIVGFIETILLPLFFIFFSRKVGISDSESFIRSLLIIGTIGATISTIAIIYPTFQSSINAFIGNVDPNSFLVRNAWRGRGFSEALTSDYSYIQASIVILFLFFNKNNKWFLCIIPFMMISIIFNARTGLLLLLGGLILFLIQTKKTLKIVMYLLIISALIYAAQYIFSSLSNTEEVTLFITDFLEQLTALYKTNDMENARTVNELYEGMQILPRDIPEWIFGRGYQLFGMKDVIGYSSDVGLTNYLSYGGITYILLILYMYNVILKRINHYRLTWFMLFFVFTIILISIKSVPFPNTGETRFLMFVYFALVYFKAKSYNLIVNRYNVSSQI